MQQVYRWLPAFVLVGVCLAANTVFGEGLRLDALERLDPASATPTDDGKLLYYEVRGLDIEGKGWQDTEAYYDRLPAKAKGVAPDSVWGLSKHSSGMAVRFVTDAACIACRWTVINDELGMKHMPATGVSGVDLYVNDNGTWRWIGAGRPTAKTSEATLADGIPEGPHEFIAYLPLYNGTESMALGVPPEATLAKAPPREGNRGKPIVFYGTSITQGGCASRPGMGYTAILGRHLDWATINLGFSGSGRGEIELADLLTEIDAAAYVLDCVPNMSPEVVTERIEPFVKRLRSAHADTPIVLVENIRYQAGAFLPERRKSYEDKNVALRAAYGRLQADGVQGLTYIPSDALLGDDGEATVDGTHLTDLGFLRYSDAVAPVLRGILAP
ncbi:MAG TPA: SGNH/GDSL hydrolase family protein [Candidatus Hydrogenedentes bacterium]|nr:SGNH/GDSL hydrolase family protein [Candidatus Hydrogenedentota bacterium]HPG69190.1 SGNH/GDSL hydrolase family protein [Candidatus Hydrogenedentota bacterium]